MDAAGTVSLDGRRGREAGRLRRRSTMSRWCCTPAAAPDGRSACRSTHANLSISAQNVARRYALTADDVSLCVMPLFHVHGLVASTLATLATGGTVVVPAKFSPLSFWRVARDHDVTWYSAVPTLHQLLLARAADPSDPSRRPAGRGAAALHPLVQRVAAAAGDARARSGVRRAGARGLRHDRSGAPDGVQPAAAGGAKARIGRPRHRRADQHHGRGGQPPAARRGAARSSSRDRTSSPATRTTPTRTRRRSPTAGSAPAIRASSTTRGTSRWCAKAPGQPPPISSRSAKSG